MFSVSDILLNLALGRSKNLARHVPICLAQLRSPGVAPLSLGRQTLKGDSTDNDIFGYLKGRVDKQVQEGSIDVQAQNGFRLFGLEEKFRIDESKLHREMRRLQGLLHPDKYVNETIKTQVQSTDLSALVNIYYKILRNPYERGKHLYALSTNRSPNEIERMLDKLQLDPPFLLRMMELREEIEGGDLDDYRKSNLKMSLESELEQLGAKLDRDFEAKNFDAVCENLGKIKFLANCNEALSNQMDASDFL